MRPWYMMVVIACFTLHVTCRPQQAEYNNVSDVEENEEEDDAAADAYAADDEEPHSSDQEPAVQEDASHSRHLLDLADARYLQSNSPVELLARIKSDADLEPRNEGNREQREEKRYDEHRKIYMTRRQPHRYNVANDDQQEIQHLTNHDTSLTGHGQAADESPANKRTIDFETTANEEEGDLIFTKNRDQVSYINKNENNANDSPDSEKPRHIKQYYDTMQTENKDMTHNVARNKLRDRRDVKDASQPEGTGLPSTDNKDSNDKSDNEDEASDIKRHIKKLSKEELDHLLSSLTEEKRELLKKIIDEIDTTENGFINKREITKKAGAVEENSFIENYQSDLSKVQGGSPSDLKAEVSTPQTTESESGKSEISCEGSDNTTQKVSDVNLSLTSNKIDDALQKASDVNLNSLSLNVDSKDQADTSNIQVTSKTESKREANAEDLEEADDSIEDNNMQDYSNDQGYFSPQDDSNLDYESQPHEEKYYKREAYSDKQPDLSDSIRALEESFPNTNEFEDSEPYSGPLIRVKRKNFDQMAKKRAARLVPDTKVAYFPYKAENEDEDNDEGNEFNDEGFYDRTSNFANGNKALEEDTADKYENVIQANSVNGDLSKALNENVESDVRSLGSDTDSVLSGAEGVDDNLMLNGGVRDKRTAEDNSDDATQTECDKSTDVMQEEAQSQTETFVNVPHYQENDAFGPLPRNYDGDLTRYKRIRRVKQFRNTGSSASDA